MIKILANWFEQTDPTNDYRIFDYVVLCLILAAGVFVRFWGLGNVGFHGDEETMALPALAILETGHPYLPSGMYYPRALLNIYMMSGSVWMFGESEWAFRLPSALVGSFTGLAAFFMGRHFLAPQFNIAFVATVTLLPVLIVESQTARMYVFFVTCIIWFAACIFRWEKDQKLGSLLLAMGVWILALHFHRLAIFAAPLFVYPGLSRQSWTQLTQGILAFVACSVPFNIYSNWVASKYPQASELIPRATESAVRAPLEILLSANHWLLSGGILVIALVTGLLLFKFARRGTRWQALPVLGAGLGLLAMATLNYHVGGLLLIASSIFWLRTPSLRNSWLLGPALLAATMLAVHLLQLHDTGLYPGRKLIGALVGAPSVWPFLQFISYMPVAWALYGVAIMYGVVRFVRGRPVPEHFLFFLLAVWAPVFLIGLFQSYLQIRYLEGQLAAFLLCAFAGLAFVCRELRLTASGKRLPPPMLAVLALVTVLLINPLTLARTVDPGYQDEKQAGSHVVFPDHKGAAEFISSLNLGPDAILIAEDILQQTYYLGGVDYWLRERSDAQDYCIVRDGQIVDFYTATPLIGDGAELERTLDRHQGNDVFIIGSGENFVDGKRLFRGDNIAEALESERLEIVYEGRDGRTTIWQLRQ